MTFEPTVFVVDDDEAVRSALARLMNSVGLSVETFPSADAYLASCDPERPGCLILDIRMPQVSGLELQEQLGLLGLSIPIIVISGHADVESAVRAMRNGAVDFLSKPFHPPKLLQLVREALALDAKRRLEAAQRADAQALVARLSPREREVFDRLIAGQPPKQIAAAMKISRKTVDIHRAHIMMKLDIETLTDLVRIAYAAGVVRPGAQTHD